LQRCDFFELDLFGLVSFYNYLSGTTDPVSEKTDAEQSDEDAGIAGDR
jgi:hypothetical protein